MKKLLFLIGIVIAINTSAQIKVDNIDLNTMPDLKYCEIVGTDVGLLKKKIIITIDYGQEDKAFDKASVIQDKDGKSVVFHSMIDALNFFEKNNWQYVNQYVITNTNNSSIYHFLLKKK